MVILTVRDDKQTAGNITVQLVIFAGPSVIVPDISVNFPVQLVTFTDLVQESGIFVTGRP